jgi:hypothetical protein
MRQQEGPPDESWLEGLHGAEIEVYGPRVGS